MKLKWKTHTHKQENMWVRLEKKTIFLEQSTQTDKTSEEEERRGQCQSARMISPYDPYAYGAFGSMTSGNTQDCHVRDMCTTFSS